MIGQFLVTQGLNSYCRHRFKRLQEHDRSLSD